MNMRSVKSANRSLILYLLNSHKTLSRKEIATKLGLSAAAVTKITQSLIDEGFIVEGEEIASNKSGRRERLLKLIDDKLILGINTEKDSICFSISKINGEAVLLHKIPFCDNVDYVINQGLLFLSNNNISFDEIFAVGVCVIGFLNEKSYSVWSKDDLKSELENAFKSPVIIENNVKAFAEAELLYGGLSSTDSALLLKWGPGIASSIIINGNVFSNNKNGVAEIGHYIVDVSGEKCRCGRFGCLETFASTDKIISEFDNKLSLEDIVQSNKENVVNLVDHKIDMVALALTNTATILNANNIILFGEMFKNDNIVKKIKKQCIRYNNHLLEDSFKLSSLNNKSGYIGATAIAAKQFYFESEGL